MRFFFIYCLVSFFYYCQVFAQFESIGPYGGYIRCLAKDNQERILAGTANGGIFGTTDMGDTWTQLFDGYRDLDVRSLAVNPGNDYFAGTDGSGLFRSTDAGASWVKLNNLISSSTINSLLVLSNGDIFAGTFDGLYKSTDNGSTFSSSSNGITEQTISSLGDGGAYLLAGTAYGGVFRSTDEGSNWTAVNNGINFNSKTVESIAFTQSGRAAVPYISLGDIMYNSPNQGINWNALPDPPKYISSIIVTQNNTVIVAATSNITSQGGGVLYLPDGAGAWIAYNLPEDPFSSIVNTTGGLMAGSEGPGTFVTTNNSDWNIKVNYMPATAVNGVDYAGGVVTVATRHCGAFVSNDLQTFQNVNGNIPWGWEYEFCKNPVTGNAFLLHQNGTYRTAFGDWNNWQNTNILANTMGFDSHGYTYLCSGAHVYKSVNDINFQSYFITGITNINKIAFDASDGIYVATANAQGNFGNGVYYSSDGGPTWNPINTNLPDNITTVAYVDLTGLTLSDCHRNIVAGSSDGKFFALKDDFSWNQFDLNFTSSSLITSIASVNYGTGVQITAASEKELVNVPDNCSPVKTATLMDQNILSFYIGRMTRAENNPAENIIEMAGTLGTGIIKRALPEGVNDDNPGIPEAFRLDQNYPNPFNPSTIIKYNIPKDGNVILKIYNTLGQMVAEPVNGFQKAGQHEVNFNASSGSYRIASGVYFYRVKTGSLSEVKKMIYLK